MRYKIAGAATALAVLATSLVAATPADARWRHRGWIGPGIGFAAGALIGSALTPRPYYYGPGAYAYGAGPYAAAPYAYEVSPNRGAVAYCLDRFKSYDVRSGTYLGYDGDRHPCP